MALTDMREKQEKWDFCVDEIIGLILNTEDFSALLSHCVLLIPLLVHSQHF